MGKKLLIHHGSSYPLTQVKPCFTGWVTLRRSHCWDASESGHIQSEKLLIAWVTEWWCLTFISVYIFFFNIRTSLSISMPWCIYRSQGKIRDLHATSPLLAVPVSFLIMFSHAPVFLWLIPSRLSRPDSLRLCSLPAVLEAFLIAPVSCSVFTWLPASFPNKPGKLSED